MSEATIVAGLITIVKSMTEFGSADVTDNDWSVLDGERNNAPFMVFQTVDSFMATQGTTTGNTSWEIPASLFVDFVDDWDTSLVEMRTTRQALIDKFNAVGSARSAGLSTSVDVHTLRNGSDILPYWLPYNDNDAEALPDYLQQVIIFEVDEGWG